MRGCLESLHDQPQGVRLEIIVVDNASTDGAPEMVDREFPEVMLVKNDANLGFSRANNQAAEKARGRYLFFLNNDTVVPPGTLRRLVDYADRHPEAGMVGPRLRDSQGQFQVSYRQRPTLAALLHRTSLLRWTGLFKLAYRHYRRQGFDPYTVRNVDILMGAAVLLPRDRFFAAGSGTRNSLSAARISNCPRASIWRPRSFTCRRPRSCTLAGSAAGCTSASPRRKWR